LTQERLFDGFEVQADLLEVPGLGKLGAGPLLAAVAVAPEDVHGGDVVVCNVPFVLYPPRPDGIKPDRKLGFFEGRFERVIRAFPFETGFEVISYTPKLQRDQDWHIAHGGRV